MIYIGIDDTDTFDTPGTNQLARALVERLASAYECVSIVRHQLLFDPRVPYTTKNGSASIVFKPRGNFSIEDLLGELRTTMRAWFKEGSDPGLCVAQEIPKEISEFGLRCQRDVVHQDEARKLAADSGIHLEGLGGTEGGVIGALAAVGLIVTGNDGRVVQLGTWPDDLSNYQPISVLQGRGVVVQELNSGQWLTEGTVDVGKHLRPNLRKGKVVQFVVPQGSAWQAVRLT